MNDTKNEVPYTWRCGACGRGQYQTDRVCPYCTQPRVHRLFNFNRNNTLSLVPLVNGSDEHVGWWLSGRIFGHLISYARKSWKTSQKKWNDSLTEEV